MDNPLFVNVRKRGFREVLIESMDRELQKKFIRENIDSIGADEIEEIIGHIYLYDLDGMSYDTKEEILKDAFRVMEEIFKNYKKYGKELSPSEISRIENMVTPRILIRPEEEPGGAITYEINMKLYDMFLEILEAWNNRDLVIISDDRNVSEKKDIEITEI